MYFLYKIHTIFCSLSIFAFIQRPEIYKVLGEHNNGKLEL